MLIALSGVDGTGKTTIATALKQKLEQENKKVIIIKVFDYLILRFFLNLFKKEKPKTNIEPAKNTKTILKFWPILAYFDNLLFCFFKILPLTRKYDYVICDRYFYDLGVSFAYYNFTTPFLYKSYLKLLPRPTRSFILDAPPETAFSRKKEFNLQYYQEERELYINLAKTKNIPIFNTLETPQQITLAICTQIPGCSKP